MKKKTIVTHARFWFVFFLILEIILRGTGWFLTHPEKNFGRYISSAEQNNIPSWYWLHAPNDTLNNQNKEFKFYRTTNSIGLSEKAISQNTNNTRLIALGDSFTECVGVNQHEGWVTLIEKDFNLKGLSLETINAGIGGSDPIFEYKLFKDKLLKYKPDILILTINSTDVSDIIARGGIERFNSDGSSGAPVPRWDWIYACSHLTRFYTHVFLNYPRPFVGGMPITREKAIQLVEGKLIDFKKLCHLHKIKFLVVLQPSLHEFKDNGYTPFDGYKEWRNTLQEYQIEYHELYLDLIAEAEKSKNPIQSFYWPIDTHFNSKGYQVYANSIVTKLTSLKWIQ